MGYLLILLGICLVGLGAFILTSEKGGKKDQTQTSGDNQKSTAEIKGIFGERLVFAVLKDLPKDYVLLSDLVVSNGAGYTQIDHVVVSPYGIFVLETKNFTGKIIGSRDAEMWTQVVKNKQMMRQNPIVQNAVHVDALQKLLSKDKTAPIIPIVVMTGNCTLKVDKLTRQDHVVHVGDLLSVIKSHDKLLVEEQKMTATINILTKANIIDSAIRETHVENLRKRQQERDALIAEQICPICGDGLILKRGNNNNFWSCNSYPQCRFSISDRMMEELVAKREG